jgi:hypothetical protein
MADDTLYPQLHDVIITLDAANKLFTPFSAQDIKDLITAKIKAKKKTPMRLEKLYKLEEMIRDLRETFDAAKERVGN